MNEKKRWFGRTAEPILPYGEFVKEVLRRQDSLHTCTDERLRRELVRINQRWSQYLESMEAVRDGIHLALSDRREQIPVQCPGAPDAQSEKKRGVKSAGFEYNQ